MVAPFGPTVGLRSMWRGSTRKGDPGQKRTSWATQLRKEADFGGALDSSSEHFSERAGSGESEALGANLGHALGACCVGAGNMDTRIDGARDESSRRTSASQSPSSSSTGCLGAVSARDACRRSWERAMMRARMRSPRWTVSRCSSEYDGDPRRTVARRLVDGLRPLARLIRSPCGWACRDPGLCRPV